MKQITWLGTSKSDWDMFPATVRSEGGHQLYLVQVGYDPKDWKPMTSVGSGVREIRINDAAGAFRVIYVANIGDSLYALHCFQKKTRKTSQRDIDLAQARFRQIRR